MTGFQHSILKDIGMKTTASIVTKSDQENTVVDGQILKEGVKKDSDKLRYDLIPPEGMEELARVYTIGARKYADRNWELGIKYGRVFGALLRHAFAWARGESLDPVDGQHHLASVAWCALALITYEKRGMSKFDDRFAKPGDNA
jgi:hypothetical protein